MHNLASKIAWLALLAVTGPVFAAPANDAWLRRLHYVYSQSDLATLQQSGPAAYVEDRLDSAAKQLNARQSTEVRLANARHVAELLEMRKKIQSAQGAEVERLKSMNLKAQNAVAESAISNSLNFLIDDSSGTAARLLWFWTNHFSVFAKKAEVRIYIEDFERNAVAPNVLGPFDQLLINAVLHPAMLIYLDNHRNTSKQGNENLAREILELHTMGVEAGYTQGDVQTLAKALTGVEPAQWNAKGEIVNCEQPACVVIQDTGAVVRLPKHDMAPKVFFGKAYQSRTGLEVIEMLVDLANRQETRQYITKKLIRYFGGDKPVPKVESDVLKMFDGSKTELRKVYGRLLSHDDLLSRKDVYFTDPTTYFVAVARTMNMAELTVNSKGIAGLLAAAGMPHFGRLTPDGYPLESSNWDNANALDGRRKAVANLMHRASLNGEVKSLEVEALSAQLIRRLGEKSRTLLAAEEKRPERWLPLYLITPEFMLY